MEHVSKQREHTPYTRSPLLAFPSHVVLSPDTEFQYPGCAEGSSARLKVIFNRGRGRWRKAESPKRPWFLFKPEFAGLKEIHTFLRNMNYHETFYLFLLVLRPCISQLLALKMTQKERDQSGSLIDQETTVPWPFGPSFLTRGRVSIECVHINKWTLKKQQFVLRSDSTLLEKMKWIRMYQLKNSNCAFSMILYTN